MGIIKSLKANRRYILSLILSIVAAFLIGAILMVVSGFDPFQGYGAMISGAFGSDRLIGNTLERSMTLCLLGLATAIGAKGGLFNVGGEGQLFFGALAATMVGLWFSNLPPAIVIIIAIVVSIIVGGFYAYIPAILKVKLHVDEVITTIMLNTVAIEVCTYFVNGPWNSTLRSIQTGTDYLDSSTRFAKLIPSSNLSVAFIYGALVTFLIWYLMKKTSTGLEIKLTGENSRFAKFAGLKADKLMIWSMIISGAICGFVGMLLVYGYEGHMTASCSNQYYFDGMLVAMIMNYNPVGIVIMSFFFGILATGSTMMDLQVGISSQLYDIIFSVIIFLMAAEGGISKYMANKKAQKEAKERARKEIENVGSDSTSI